MGWLGIKRALLARNEQYLLDEMSIRNNPNDPQSALAVAVQNCSPGECAFINAWADGWLREPANDCLRARGDRRWQVMNSVEVLTRTTSSNHEIMRLRTALGSAVEALKGFVALYTKTHGHDRFIEQASAMIARVEEAL